MAEAVKKRFISVRLTEAEFQKVQKLIRSSACHSLTEYVKKILLNKPVVIKVRDQAKDDILECLINIKNKLALIEDQAAEKDGPQLLAEIKEARLILFKIYTQWSLL
jgi:hypothetical protein